MQWGSLEGRAPAGTTGCSLRNPKKREDKIFYIRILSTAFKKKKEGPSGPQQ